MHGDLGGGGAKGLSIQSMKSKDTAAESSLSESGFAVAVVDVDAILEILRDCDTLWSSFKRSIREDDPSELIGPLGPLYKPPTCSSSNLKTECCSDADGDRKDLSSFEQRDEERENCPMCLLLPLRTLLRPPAGAVGLTRSIERVDDRSSDAGEKERKSRTPNGVTVVASHQPSGRMTGVGAMRSNASFVSAVLGPTG
mmetsp:Transcript_2071/g.3160  ORF Transcript_2071/g.3160 Transcript_2071/m.3160 type:complete len:198 (-) Transcript_2071:347-940(-)